MSSGKVAKWQSGNVVPVHEPTLPLCHSVTRPLLPLGLSFPVHDIQFWLATALFIAAMAWLLKGVLPVPILTKRLKRRRGQTRATLTVGGKVVKKE